MISMTWMLKAAEHGQPDAQRLISAMPKQEVEDFIAKLPKDINGETLAPEVSTNSIHGGEAHDGRPGGPNLGPGDETRAAARSKKKGKKGRPLKTAKKLQGQKK